MRCLAIPLAVLGAHLAPLAAPLAAQAAPQRVGFRPGNDLVTIKSEVQLRSKVSYVIDGRQGQFLTVSVSSSNPEVRFRIDTPRQPGRDTELFSSKSRNESYRGQLFLDGEHTITVSLPKGDPRRTPRARFDLSIGLTGRPGRPPAAGNRPVRPPNEQDWSRVRMEPRSHAPLLARLQNAPRDLTREPVATTLVALRPDLSGVVSTATTAYNGMENPSEVTVTVTEAGILDDDLLGVRHAVNLARNRNGEWRIVRYAQGELRRRHLR